MGSDSSKEEETNTKKRDIRVSTEVIQEVNEFFCKSMVTQKFTNPLENPLELQIFILQKKDMIFSSFNCKIGNSLNVKSKVIKLEKAEQKYTDAIASGNAAIYVKQINENKILISMGNIPPKNEVIFISEYIHSMEPNKKFEFELYRNLPIFMGKDYNIIKNVELNGTVNIKTQSKIINIEKIILMKNLNIISEQYENDNKYIIKYEILELPSFSWSMIDKEYIPSSKIYFNVEQNNHLSLVQESILDPNLEIYSIQCRLTKKNSVKNKEVINPSLFIFLIDQSGSMYGYRMKVASQALILFLQSIPVGSYYQIIGFGSNFELYDEKPKEYNKENIKISLKIIEELEANLGGTDIYSPLKYIYDNPQYYDEINLPRNIFLLTDGYINNKAETLNLIEVNSSIYNIYSIGIGKDFDEDLIKNAGVIGKGNYNFCENLDNLNSIIASEIKKCSTSTNCLVKEMKCNLDNNNLISNIFPSVIRDDYAINLYYLVKKDDKKNEKINLNIKYKESEIIEKNYEISSERITKGEELFKIAINNYMMKNYNLTEKQKLELALKYQIFTKDTSLFAEVEIDDKVSEKMKLQILGPKETNMINYMNYGSIDKALERYSQKNYLNVNSCMCDMILDYTPKEEDADQLFNTLLEQYNKEKGIITNEIKESKMEKKLIEGEKEEKIEEINLDNKEHIMKMINTQDFIEGCWEENSYTKKLKEKYIEEYNSIKGIKNKNIDNNTALTILIIYFINKMHPELLKDLLMIFEKAKMFIEKKTKDKYDNIIKILGIN